METVTTLNGSIPSTMRAAVYRGINDVRVEKVPVPEIGAGEVLVKIHSCGICGTDLKKIHTGSHSAPRIFGHEMAGVIAAVGDKVSGWRVGDRVMAFHHIPCGKGCYYCKKKTFSQCESYKRVGCTAGFEPSGGGFAEYIRVMDWIVERGLVRIPDHVPFEQALWIEPVNTCYKAIHNLRLEADETVLVIGQGPIGILLASLARQTGATVLTSDLYPSRHEVASQFDLRHPIYADKQNPIAVVKEHTEGRGADVVIVAVGGNALIRPAMDAARFGGRVLLFAATQHGETVIDPAAICMDEKALIGSYSSSADVQHIASQLVLDGYPDRFNLTHLISHTFPLEQAAEAIVFASEPKPDSMKVVIQP
ncbi:MAG TPA: zinc-dependent dehydrogenase [Acidobacteriaceae bacterium]|nr:zinc-dependent dehydrogenase [Acidobacteriaceae bacterium]